MAFFKELSDHVAIAYDVLEEERKLLKRRRDEYESMYSYLLGDTGSGFIAKFKSSLLGDFKEAGERMLECAIQCAQYSIDYEILKEEYRSNMETVKYPQVDDTDEDDEEPVR